MVAFRRYVGKMMQCIAKRVRILVFDTTFNNISVASH